VYVIASYATVDLYPMFSVLVAHSLALVGSNFIPQVQEGIQLGGRRLHEAADVRIKERMYLISSADDRIIVSYF
jgi:hypothetical protein